MPTRVYRAYYGGKNLDKMEGITRPENSRFPEDWIASVTLAFNPGREVPFEGLSQTEDGAYLKDLIEQDKEKHLGSEETMALLFKKQDAL